MFWRTVHDFSKWAPVALAAVFTAFITASLAAAGIWDGAKIWVQNAFEGALDMAALPWIWLLAAPLILLWLFVVIWSGRKASSNDIKNLLNQDRAEALREVADLRNMTDSITARAPMVDSRDRYRELDRLRVLMNTIGMDRKGVVYFDGVRKYYSRLRAVRSMERETELERLFQRDQNGWCNVMLQAHADALAGWIRGERVWRRYKREMALLDKYRPEHEGFGFKQDEAGKWRLTGYGERKKDE